MSKNGVPIQISEPVARVLRLLTHESNLELAISKVLKELVQFKLKRALTVINGCEEKYGMSFSQFEQARLDEKIADFLSNEVQQDGKDWDAAEADKKFLLKAKNDLEIAYPESPKTMGFSMSGETL